MGLIKVLLKSAYQRQDWDSLYVCLCSRPLSGIDLRDKYTHCLYKHSKSHYLQLLENDRVNESRLPLFDVNRIRELANQEGLSADQLLDRSIFVTILRKSKYCEEAVSYLFYSSDNIPAMLTVLKHHYDNKILGTVTLRVSINMRMLKHFHTIRELFNIDKFKESLVIKLIGDHNITTEHIGIVNYLLDHGVRLSDNACSWAFNSVLMNWTSSTELFDILIERGYDPRLSRYPVLVHLGAKCRDPHVLEKLLVHGVDINEKFQGFTALQLAAHEKNATAVERLVDLGASCTELDGYNRVALVYWYMPLGVYFGPLSGRSEDNWKFPLSPDRYHDISYREPLRARMRRYSNEDRVLERAPQSLFDNTPIDYVAAFLELDTSAQALLLFDHIREHY